MGKHPFHLKKSQKKVEAVIASLSAEYRDSISTWLQKLVFLRHTFPTVSGQCVASLGFCFDHFLVHSCQVNGKQPTLKKTTKKQTLITTVNYFLNVAIELKTIQVI